MQETTTTDFSKFGSRERKMAAELLTALDQNCPDDFDLSEVQIMMNFNSGNVFLVNGDYQTAMMNGDDLESFYSTPYSGHEGFWGDLVNQYAEMHPQDQGYMRDIANGRDLPKEED